MRSLVPHKGQAENQHDSTRRKDEQNSAHSKPISAVCARPMDSMRQGKASRLSCTQPNQSFNGATG